ncbi:type II toxin-antitoxin system Phd/YefM family antitoxin [Bosea sp. PAMC 26642]|uniref:type II toxin-antitoxin system Phd/YefM family antitoxin n=1 Tax=Bosea sp. (strain PAMC 26642) TaxID=1792307 RepID=UPI00077009C4|nr:type II toxin-antitoxin system Phd/YefM family antitoxin [Bosea sp. PAMC 26642]AMJ60421.1 hypothetical protein AXW83_09070 [Bosea sp. PAMC 26642]
MKPDQSLIDRWPLADARTKFDDLMRRALETGPQRVTVHGRDTVIVLDVGDYERLVASPPARQPEPDGASLIATMAAAPFLGDIDLERDGERSPMRDVAL